MTLPRQGKKVRVVQLGGWRYAGLVLEETDDFLILKDDLTQREVTLRRDSLLVLEVLDG